MNVFPLPVLYTNWGFTSDWTASAQPLIDHAKAAGFKTIAVRIAYTPPERCAELHAMGFVVIGWENLSQFPPAGLDLRNLDGVQPQIESDAQRDATIAAFKAGWGRDLKLAPTIATTYSGLEQGQYAQLSALGVKGCLVECYAADGKPHDDLTRMLGQGVVYKIPGDHLVAVCGTYRQETPASYSGIEGLGRNVGVYLAEPMTPATWDAWKLTALPTDPVPPVDPKLVNQQIVADADRWLSQQTDTKPLSRLRIISRIATNGTIPDDPKWVAARDKIKAALDQAGIP